MNDISLDALKRLLKLPLKFGYLLLCLIASVLMLLILSFPIKRKKSNRFDSSAVLCVSYLSMSFDGRMKKTINQLVSMGKSVTFLKPVDAQEDEVLQFSGLTEKVSVKAIGLSGVFSHFPRVVDVMMLWYMLFSKEKFLHCRDINTAFMGLFCSMIMGKMVIFDLYDWKLMALSPDKTGLGILQKKIYALTEKLTIIKSDFVIATSDVMLKEIKDYYKINRDVFMVNNMPKICSLKPYNLRKELAIADDNVLLVYYVGQLAPYRNIEGILHAVSVCDHIIFALQGAIDSSYMNALKSLCIDLNIIDRVFFLPPIAHDFISSACQGADLGIFTCNTESKSMFYSLPNKLFEYIIGEIPIIAEDIPAVRGYITDNNIGSLVQSNSPDSIAEAFRYYLDDRSQLQIQKENVLLLKDKMINDDSNFSVYSEIYR